MATQLNTNPSQSALTDTAPDINNKSLKNNNKKRRKKNKKKSDMTTNVVSKDVHEGNNGNIGEKDIKSIEESSTRLVADNSIRTTKPVPKPETVKPDLLIDNPMKSDFSIATMKHDYDHFGLQPPKSFDNVSDSRSDHSSSSRMSPRKQAIMRHKKDDEHSNNDSMINEMKFNLKPNKSNTDSLDSNDKLKRPKPYVDEKLSLFKFKSAKILVFDEQLEPESPSQSSSGRLLGHGEFEIFQLHNGDVTYLSCGPSFIYPLLPKLKVLRVNFNQFILPLVNPERYWRIFINSIDESIIKSLETVLENVISYRNLAIGATPPKELISIPQPVIHTPQKNESLPLPNDSLLEFNMAQISNDIPDSPPSVPLSPHHNLGLGKPFHLESFQEPKPPALKNEFFLPRDLSNKSITSAMASLDVNGTLGPIMYSNPTLKPSVSTHLFKKEIPRKPKKVRDDKSDSSLDSLLDEYELSRSVYTQSRAPSRPISRSSSFLRPPDPRHYFDNQENDFPTTSLSEYNRIHGVSRSRRSSKSELYTSESNWMEPNGVPVKATKVPIEKFVNESKLPHSKSTHSLASNQSRDLNSTYKEIYKSIAQRNLNRLVEKDHRPHNTLTNGRLPTIEQSKTLKTNFNSNYRTRPNNPRYEKPRYENERSRRDVLSSNDVYNILNDKEKEKKGFASRIFGW